MSFGPENAQGEFELTGEARDSHIFEMVGIAPDPRGKISQEEIRQLIIGTQVGDAEAQERLIATRLRWIYSHAFSEEIRSRADLELRDVMQVGILATLEATDVVNVEYHDVSVLFHTNVPRIMNGWITEGKLIPALDEEGRTVRRPTRDRSIMRDRVELVDQAELDSMIERTAEGREDDVAIPEAMILGGSLEWLFDYASLSEKQREVLRLRYDAPIADETGDLPRQRNHIEAAVTLTLREVIARLGTSTQNVSMLERSGLRKIRRALEPPKPKAPPAPVSPEQQARREQWFAEIAEKQKRGEVAFVKGSLLKRPLPGQVQYYFETGHFHGKTGGTALKLALRAAEEEPEWSRWAASEEDRRSPWRKSGRSTEEN